MANLITGLFDTESAAESAVDQLKQIGYSHNEISIIMKDRAAAADMADTTGARAMEGVGTGAAIGGTIGAILAGLLAVGSVTIPGVGLIAAGPLAAMLAGAGAGGLAGSLLGWLVGAGIPEDVAPYYERGLYEGGVVVAVASHPGDEQRVQNILHGGSVAYAGYNTPSYVAPAYASRYNDLTPPLVAAVPAPIIDNGVPGVQTGGTANDGTPDTRGILEKTADSVTGDIYDDKTGKPVLHPDHPGDTTYTRDDMADADAHVPGNRVPGIQTGGRAVDGTPDTRGMTEKAADALTGDRMDDKTGKPVR